MNIFFRELKAYRKGLFFWSIGMIFLIASGMAKFAAFQSSGQSFNTVMEQLPKSFQTIFGLTGFDLSKVSGQYGVLFFYIALMATVHAVLLGTDIVSKEERDRTSEFLFVKPISRTAIMTAKLAAGLTSLIIFNLVTLVSSIYIVDYFNKGGSVTNDILVLMSGLLFLQLIFFSIGTAIAAVSKKPKATPSIATAVLLATFILSFFVNLDTNLNNLKYLTPFKYFDAKTLIANGKLDPVYVAISLAIVIATIITTYATYAARDLSV
jgi:ABC-2 type transport system permease protein